MKAASHCDSDKDLSFWGHLEILRVLLIRAVVVVLIMTVALFAVMPKIFDEIILAPCSGSFPLYRWLDAIGYSSLFDGGAATMERFEGIDLVNINLSSQFLIHLSSSFWLALLLSAPVLLWLAWRFISPALLDGERKPVSAVMIFGSLMFYSGVILSYSMIFPLTLRFLAGYQLSPEIPNVISIDSYMDTLLGLSLMTGLAFELPLVSWMLGRVGLLHRNVFRRYRRHAVVILLIMAAVITPTGDPFTLAVVFLPLYLLWELSAVLVPKAKEALA